MEKADACFYRRRNDMLYAACAVGVHMIEMNLRLDLKTVFKLY